MGAVISAPGGESLVDSQFVKINTTRTVQQVLEEQKQKGGNFTDSEFLPEDSSLYYDKASLGDLWRKDIVWKRAKDCKGVDKDKHLITLGEGPLITAGDVTPNDIEQGTLGDCYFLCSLSVLAEHKERIQKIFPSLDRNESGVYGVRFMKHGILQEVVVDDHFPCQPSGLCVFSHSNKPEMWVPLAEKAYAKLHGSYQKIEGGDGGEALEDLTGAPSKNYKMSDLPVDELWEKVKSADALDYTMSLSCGKENAEATEKMGLQSSHQYGLLVAKEYGNIRLVSIRNPWGHGEWKGDYSDSSPLWTEELKKHFDWKDADDGSFWMSIEDVHRYFSGLTFLYYHNDYQYSYVDLAPSKLSNGVMVTTPEGNGGKVKCWVSVKQRDKRASLQGSGYDYAAVQFHVVQAKPEGKLLEPSLPPSLGKRDTHLEIELERGCTYWVNIRTTSTHYPMVVSTYCPFPVSFQTLDSRGDMDALLKDLCIKELAAKGTEEGNFGKEGLELKKLQTPYGILIGYYNNSKDTKLKEQVTFEADNMEILSLQDKTYSSTTISIELPPGGTELLALISKDVGKGWKFRQARQYVLIKNRDDSTETYNALWEKTKKEGENQPFQGAPEGLTKHLLRNDEGMFISYHNAEGSGMLLEEKSTFSEVLNMDLHIIGVDGNLKLVDPPSSTLELRPGQSAFYALRPTPKAAEEGSSYAYQLSPGGVHQFVVFVFAGL